MSQDGSCHPTNSDLSDELVLAKHCLVETNPSDLMDKPFLEPSLNQSVPLLPDPRPAVRDTLQPVYQPTVILVLRTFVQSLQVVPHRQPASYVASARRLSLPSSEPTYQSVFASQSVNNRFILCLACASVTVMSLLWAGSQVISSDDVAVAPPVLTPQQGSSLPAVSAADVRSTAHTYPKSVESRKLPQLVDRSAKQNTPSTVIQPAKVPLPANPQVPANTVISVPARVTERIFVPVYRPSPAQAMASKPQATYRASVTSATPSVSASPVASPSHTLVGVMEFGDRSAALIDINHVIQRIRIGELTPDGWKLTKVIDQKAVLQRGGKLRSIYVGQKF